MKLLRGVIYPKSGVSLMGTPDVSRERRRSVYPLPATMQTVTKRYPNSDEPGRLHGHWLIVVRIAWIMCVALTLVIFFASLPEYSAQLQTSCVGSSCWYTQLSDGQIEALRGIGLSPGVYAGYTIALTLASVMLCLVV